MKRYANEPFRELTAPSATNAFRSFIPRLAGPSRINKDIFECVNKIPEGGGGKKRTFRAFYCEENEVWGLQLMISRPLVEPLAAY